MGGWDGRMIRISFWKTCYLFLFFYITTPLYRTHQHHHTYIYSLQHRAWTLITYHLFLSAPKDCKRSNHSRKIVDGGLLFWFFILLHGHDWIDKDERRSYVLVLEWWCSTRVCLFSVVKWNCAMMLIVWWFIVDEEAYAISMLPPIKCALKLPISRSSH